MAKGRGKSKRIRSANSEMNAYLNDLKSSGHLLEMSTGGHWKIYLMCDRPLSEHYGRRHCRDCSFTCSTSASPSDHRTLSNVRRQVRATGRRKSSPAERNKPGRDVVK